MTSGWGAPQKSLCMVSVSESRKGFEGFWYQDTQLMGSCPACAWWEQSSHALPSVWCQTPHSLMPSLSFSHDLGQGSCHAPHHDQSCGREWRTTGGLMSLTDPWQEFELRQDPSIKTPFWLESKTINRHGSRAATSSKQWNVTFVGGCPAQSRTWCWIPVLNLIIWNCDKEAKGLLASGLYIVVELFHYNICSNQTQINV